MAGSLAGSSLPTTGTAQALLDACAARDATAVSTLLKDGADPNAAGPGGITPLLACFPKCVLGSPAACIEEACRLGENSGPQEPCSRAQLDAVGLLLQHGAEPWQPSEAGLNPLHAAAACSTQVLKLLLTHKSGGSRSSQPVSPQGTSPANDAVPDMYSPELQSSTSDSHQCGYAGAAKPAAGGRVGLLAALACMRGCPEALQLLLQFDLVPDLQAALVHAVEGLHVDVAGCVIAAGARPKPMINYLDKAVQQSSQKLKMTNSSDVPRRLSGMVKLLIQHGFTNGAFKAAEDAVARGLSAVLVALHGAGVDMQPKTQQGGGLLELALEHGNIVILPLLVSMGVVWQDRHPGQPTFHARSVHGCKPRALFGAWLRTGVGLHYAQQHGLTAMAAAYQQLQDVLSPPPALVDSFIEEYQARRWPQEQDSWHVGMRTAVLRRTLEVLQDPQQLGQLVQRLEASSWLQQSRQTFKWPVLTPEAAAVSCVVDAAAFRASGGVVLAAAAATAAAAGDQQTVMCTDGGIPSRQAQVHSLPAAPGIGHHRATASETCVDSSTAAAECASSTSSTRTALGLPVEVVCALDLLILALLSKTHRCSTRQASWPVLDVVRKLGVQLLEVLLQLGVPASYPAVEGTAMPGTPVCWSIRQWTQFKGNDRDTAAAIVQMLMQHGAQLDERINNQSCIAQAVALKDVQLLRALLSCPNKMTPAAQKELEKAISGLYKQQHGAAGWLALLSAKGLDVLPHVGEVVELIPKSSWPEGEIVRAVEALVELGWDINTPHMGTSGKTILFMATRTCRWLLLQWLLEHKADCGTLSLDTLLLVASQSGMLEGIRVLLAAGIVMTPEHMHKMSGQLAQVGRYTVSAAEKWLHGQARLQERQQQQQLAKEDNGAPSSSKNSGAAHEAAAAAAAAEAAAAELLAAEEAAEAATAAKAAKKVGKKQRQAAAKEAAAEAAAARERQEADRAAATAAEAAAKSAAAAAKAVSPVTGSAMGFQQPASTEAAQPAQQHVQQAASDTSSQAESMYGLPQQQQLQQHQQQQQQQNECVPDRAAGSAPAVYGASLGSPGTSTTPATLPGVAGLFLELSARRSGGGVAASTPSPGAAAAAGNAAHGGTSSSSPQLQRLGSSSADGHAALQQAVPAYAAVPAATSSSSGSRMPILLPSASGAAGFPVLPSWSINSSSSAHTPPGQVEGGAGPSPVVGAAARAPEAARPSSHQPPGPQLQAPPSDGTAGPMRWPIKVDKSCIVCMEARCCVLQSPCGHLICCEACTQLLRAKGRECPMCRTEVTEYWVL